MLPNNISNLQPLSNVGKDRVACRFITMYNHVFLELVCTPMPLKLYPRLINDLVYCSRLFSLFELFCTTMPLKLCTKLEETLDVYINVLA